MGGDKALELEVEAEAAVQQQARYDSAFSIEYQCRRSWSSESL
jgi:hypothetical protein